MDCVNHSGKQAIYYCQNCGKGLCDECVIAGALRNVGGDKILCDTCLTAWQNYAGPFVPTPSSGPNPAAAAVLGLIPGVGAMYNGQFFKGLIHVIIFAVLISLSEHYGIFGLFIAAWVLYQSFEAYHTALARRDGQPLPDPLGLNEVGNWLNLGNRNSQNSNQPYPNQPNATATGQNATAPAATTSAPFEAGYQPPHAQSTYAAPPPAPVDPNVPPQHPDWVRPLYWKRGEPIGAFVLIGLGMMFLLNQLDLFHGQVFKYSWPIFLIGLGVWMMIRRVGDGRGGPQ